VTWDDPLYPQGLGALPDRVRPALLFYRGNPRNLEQPRILLAPSQLADTERGQLREAVGLLLDEKPILAACDGSDQAALLTEELVLSGGTGMLFAREGLSVRAWTARETSLVEEGRLLVISPLPPDTGYQETWRSVLTQVAVAAADRVLISGSDPGDATTAYPKPVLCLCGAVPERAPTPRVVFTSSAPDVLVWIDEALAESIGEADAGSQETGSEAVPAAELAADASGAELGPPPTASDILETLAAGGSVPEALRKRLMNGD
jgi:hypothetical protein